MKMVKLKTKGVNSFDWIATKYNPNGNYGASCLTDFTEACFVGTDSGEETYTVELVASNEGTKMFSSCLSFLYSALIILP